MDNPEMNTNPLHKPITCPQCGRREIAFVTEYHKCIGLRIARNACLILSISILYLLFSPAVLCVAGSAAGSSTNYFRPGAIYVIPILLILAAIITSIFIYIIERKTHIQAICRDCGHLWLVN